MGDHWPRVPATFTDDVDRRRPRSVEHGLMDHPLLSLEQIAVLAERLGPDSVSAEHAEKPLVTSEADSRAGGLGEGSLGDRIRSLETSGGWFSLLHVQQVPEYRALVDEIVDNVARRGGLDPRSLVRRTGFVFAGSPGAVTAAHFDIEHSMCLQLRGERVLGMGRFTDAEQREQEIAQYWAGTYGRMATMAEPTHEFDLAPGVGVYIPPWTPHWITNGPNTSLSLTVTFFNRSNADEASVQAFNHRLGRIGVRPAAPGRRPRLDRAKVAFMRGYAGIKGVAHRARARDRGVA